MVLKSGKNAILVLLLAVNFLVGASWGIHRGLYSLFVKDVLLITSFTQIGLVVSVFGITKTMTNFSLGALSDRVGRKPTIILGAILWGLGGAMIALATTYDMVLVGTALFGLGQGSSLVGIMVSINETVPNTRRGLGMGLFELVVYGGSSFGSALGGYLAVVYGLRMPFYSIVILSIIATVVCIVMVSETKVPEKKVEKLESSQGQGSYIKHLIHLTPLYISGFSSKIMDSFIWSFLPLYLTGLKMDVAEIATITSAFTFSWSLSQPLSGHISDKLGRKKLVLLGLVSTAASFLLYMLTSDFVLILVFALMQGFAAALFYTPLVAMVSDAAPPNLEGTLIGSYRFFRDMGYFVGPILLGVIADSHGLQFSIYATSLSLLIAMVIVQFSSREAQ